MDDTLFTWTLINICCCSIITTSIAVQIFTIPIINEHMYMDFFDRVVKSTFVFGLLELISSCVMVTMATWAWGPLIILTLCLFLTSISLYSMYQVVEGLEDAYEKHLRRSNVIRGALWVLRFFYLFILLLIEH